MYRHTVAFFTKTKLGKSFSVVLVGASKQLCLEHNVGCT